MAMTVRAQRSRRASSSRSHDEEIDLKLKITRTVPIKIKRHETIGNLKALIREKEGISEKNQDLVFGGNPILDAQRLVDYGIRRNSTIQLILPSFVVMKILVKLSSSGRVITVEAKACHTVQNIKSMIQEKEGIQADKFTLVYDGNLLEDDRTLASLNIVSDSTIHLVFSPKEVLTIFVKALNEEIVKLSVKVMFTVGDAKAIFGSMIGVAVNNRNLFHAGKQLEDSKTLAFYDIKDEAFLELSTPPFQISVKTYIGQTLTLDVYQCNTVKDIKAKVFEKLKIPVHLQCLIYAGKLLQDGQDLASCCIQMHSVLDMVFASRHQCGS